MLVTPDDHVQAERIATLAGEALIDLRARLVADAAPASVLKNEGDRRAHQLIVDELTAARPDDAILSEEGVDDTTRLEADRVWIVDPLDGTREFSEPPRSDWAVHVALVVDHVPVAGAVALPALGITLSTATPPQLNAAPATPRMIVSRSRPPAAALRVAEAMGADLVEMGSAGAKAMAVVRGDAEIYAHSGGQYEWDSCAPVAVCAAAGLHVSRIDGSALRYNQRDVYLPDLLICRPELADEALRALAS